MSESKNTNTSGIEGQIELTEKQKKAQRARNIAIALVLIAFVVIVYVGTWAKLGANVMVRPL